MTSNILQVIHTSINLSTTYQVKFVLIPIIVHPTDPNVCMWHINDGCNFFDYLSMTAVFNVPHP